QARYQGSVSSRLTSRSGGSLKSDPEDRAARRRLYIDTSAYLCILLGEEGSELLSKETTGAELLSSVLLVLETRRNLVRLARDGQLEQDQYKTCISRVEQDKNRFELRYLTLDLCEARAMPAVTTSRSLDLPTFEQLYGFMRRNRSIALSRWTRRRKTSLQNSAFPC